MVLPQFENLLQRAMGLDPASVGSAAIERAVLERQSALHLGPEAYWGRVLVSEAELQELIEAVVVPETWFFRDREAFAALVGVILPGWLRTHPPGVFRLLSLPCSSGEEPYSMSMALLDAGFPAGRFRIDAVDISARALERARLGIYGKNSFRGSDVAFRDRHFEATAQGFRLTERVRGPVHLRHGNLFASGFTEIYDVIFCRNVLIYFDGEAQTRAIKVLERLLTAKGVLFVGPSEAAVLLNHGFASAKVPSAFAFRKAEAVPREPAPIAARSADSPVPPRQAPRTESGPVRAYKAKAPVRPAQHLGPTEGRPQLELERAARLADQGKLDEAVSCCENYLRKNAPTALALYLLGLVRDAAHDQSGAADYYRKALYLDPKHRQSLAHLALLLEGQGDLAGAQLLRKRTERLGK